MASLMKFGIRVRLVISDRIAHMAGPHRSRGEGVLGWVLAAAATAAIGYGVYKAIDTKALEKIGIISRA